MEHPAHRSTDEVAAEISAAQNISHARAVGQIRYGRALCERLPAVATVFARGVIDFRMVLTIIARTHNVEDTVIAELDAAIARHAEKWMKLSKPKLADRIDLWVAKIDPAAVPVPPVLDNTRCLDVDPAPSVGLAFAAGHVRAADGAARISGWPRWPPRCASTTRAPPPSAAPMPADRSRAQRPPWPASVAATTAQPVPARRGHHRRDPRARRASPLDAPATHPGYLPGFGILPAESVRRLAATATRTPVPIPTQSQPDPGYRPSAKTLEFIRWRDLTCRWPSCDKPAPKSDIDHTVPYPVGPTHPSNTKPYCRTHHLIKTLLHRPRGWTDQQHPDGTIVFTAPHRTRLHHRTHGAAMFPALAQPTAELHPPPQADPPSIRPLRDDAAPQTNPRPRPPRPHHRRTPPTHQTHRRPTTPTKSLASHQLPTPTLLKPTTRLPAT